MEIIAKTTFRRQNAGAAGKPTDQTPINTLPRRSVTISGNHLTALIDV